MNGRAIAMLKLYLLTFFSSFSRRFYICYLYLIPWIKIEIEISLNSCVVVDKKNKIFLWEFVEDFLVLFIQLYFKEFEEDYKALKAEKEIVKPKLLL